MIEKDKEAFERYVESRPEYYFGLSKYDKAHDLQVWLDATKWERKRTEIMVNSLKSFCECDKYADYKIKCGACNSLDDYFSSLGRTE
jgi:hypothetical protein